MIIIIINSSSGSSGNSNSIYLFVCLFFCVWIYVCIDV